MFCRLIITVLNVRKIIWWKISIQLSTSNLGYPEDISVSETYGNGLAESYIANIADSTLKNKNFIMNFISNVDNYISGIGKKFLHL